jgi:hypothetical protein
MGLAKSKKYLCSFAFIKYVQGSKTGSAAETGWFYGRGFTEKKIATDVIEHDRHELEKRDGGGKGNWGTVGEEM